MDDVGKFFFAPHVLGIRGSRFSPCMCDAIVCAVHDAYFFFSKAYVCAYAKGAKNSESQMVQDSVRKKEGQPTFHFLFFSFIRIMHLIWLSEAYGFLPLFKFSLPLVGF